MVESIVASLVADLIFFIICITAKFIYRRYSK